jgi:hypothetical protein
MSDNTLTVTEVVNSVTVTPVTNTVTVSEVGTQGPAGTNGTNGINGTSNPKISQYWYRTQIGSFTNVTPTHQNTFYTPFFIDKSTTIDRISIVTGGSFSGSSTVRLGIYNDTNGLPSTVFYDAGTVNATSFSTAYSITINQTLAAGSYWLAFCQQSTAPATGTYIGGTTTTSVANTLLWASATQNGSFIAGFSQSSVTGAFATAGTLAAATTTPYVWVRPS